MKTSRKFFAALASLAIAISLSGCTNDPLAEQFRSGDNKNYIAGDGTVTEFAEGNRPKAAAWNGTTESGEALSSSQLAGVVTVINFWYASCAPCRAEIPDLVALQDEFLEQGVQFIGVNVRDTAETALAFDRKFKVNFPSIIDAQTGTVVLAFTGVVTPQAVPTTLVIDGNGDVSARVLGKIDKAILKALIKSAVESK